MKWFKHETNAHTNLKLQTVLSKFGIEGYGYYWACVELVGLQGENYRLRADKDWKNLLKKFLEVEISKQDTFLTHFALKELIDKKALKKGDLYIPKLAERSDDYTNKVRRMSGQGTDNIPLEENRTEKNKTEEIKYTEQDMNLAELLRDRIRDNMPTFKEPNLKQWAEHVRKMREIDKRTPAQIEYLINWVQKDSFWKANILSTSKLRDKFDQLVAKVAAQKGGEARRVIKA